MNITHRQYRLLSDHMAVYQFMLEIYERDWRNGVPAPFLEYALSSDWMDKSLVHRNRIWFDDDKIRKLCGIEYPVRLVITVGYPKDDTIRPKKRKDMAELVTEL